jgi:hypothetical protein
MTAIDSPNWVQRYEDLRVHSVGSAIAFGPPAWGLVLLVQQGVRGWMRAWQDPLRAASMESTPPPNPHPSLNGSGDTTLLLANMAMRSLAVSP